MHDHLYKRATYRSLRREKWGSNRSIRCLERYISSARFVLLTWTKGLVWLNIAIPLT
jgi:hypothetical protein